MLCVFDSNQDKIFNKQDVEFNKFLIWQDKNQNGASEEGELTAFEQLGMIAIDFTTQQPIGDLSLQELGALNIADILWADGKVTKAYDLVFYHE
jgi:hypothetical protein